MKNELLKPKTDLVFKAIFGSEDSKEILESFLRAVLNIPKNTKISITIKDPFTRIEKSGDKYAVIDLEVESDNEITLMEIQNYEDPAMSDRIIYGLSKAVTNQKKEGDDYRLKKVVSILITNYQIIKTHGKYHDKFHYHSKETGNTFSRSTEIHTLELTKLPPKEDNTMLYNWLKFISAENREEIEMLAKKDPVIEKAYFRLEELSADEKFRKEAHNRAMMEWSVNARLQEARTKGLEEGREQGLEEGREQGLEEGRETEKIETAIEMISQGFDELVIASVLKKTVEWVKQVSSAL